MPVVHGKPSPLASCLSHCLVTAGSHRSRWFKKHELDIDQSRQTLTFGALAKCASSGGSRWSRKALAPHESPDHGLGRGPRG